MQEHLRRCYFSELFWESCTPHDHSSAVVQMVREGYTWILTPRFVFAETNTSRFSPRDRIGSTWWRDYRCWIIGRVSCLDRQPCCARLKQPLQRCGPQGRVGCFEDLFNRVITYPAAQFTFCDWFLFEPGSAVLARGEVLIYILASSRNGIINRQSNQQRDRDAAGNTIPVSGRVISEIYLGERPHHPGNSTLGDNHSVQLTTVT